MAFAARGRLVAAAARVAARAVVVCKHPSSARLRASRSAPREAGGKRRRIPHSASHVENYQPAPKHEHNTSSYNERPWDPRSLQTPASSTRKLPDGLDTSQRGPGRTTSVLKTRPLDYSVVTCVASDVTPDRGFTVSPAEVRSTWIPLCGFLPLVCVSEPSEDLEPTVHGICHRSSLIRGADAVQKRRIPIKEKSNFIALNVKISFLFSFRNR